MAIITYDGDEFKSINCIPEYADYPTIYVAKTPHVDETGRSYQVINTAWGNQKITHPVYDYTMKNGYHQVNLPRVGGHKSGALVHRLVFLAWQPELPVNYGELDINHLDETRDNNCFDNLEMITHQQNLNYGERNKRRLDTLIRTGQTTKIVAINIKTKCGKRFNTTRGCARSLNLDQGNINHCLAGRHRSQKGYVFCREEEYSPTKVDELIARATRRKTKN